MPSDIRSDILQHDDRSRVVKPSNIIIYMNNTHNGHAHARTHTHSVRISLLVMILHCYRVYDKTFATCNLKHKHKGNDNPGSVTQKNTHLIKVSKFVELQTVPSVWPSCFSVHAHALLYSLYTINKPLKDIGVFINSFIWVPGVWLVHVGWGNCLQFPINRLNHIFCL